jgi:alkylhydroperoxidase family enzyme
MAWIRTISPEDARGKLKAVYDAAVKRAGRVFHIVRAMSLAPQVLKPAMELYHHVMFARSDLSRRQREMLAVVVSWTNRCHY